jgi:hypothetical protein
MLIRNLTDRLKLNELLRREPGILDEKLDVAGVIIGQARGGSTLLQRLMARSPQLTSTLFWEVLEPLPFPGEAPDDPSPRIRAAEAIVAHLLASWPDVRSWHPMSATEYEEEIHLLDRAFMSSMYMGYFFMPGYARWLVEQDHQRAYDELVVWLKVLQAQRPERRERKWILKSPNHFLAGALSTVLKTFPDAQVVMTHRRMEDMIPSICSIAANAMEGSGSAVDRLALGPFYVELYRRAFEVMMDHRRQAPAGRFLDLRYETIVGDSLGVFRQVMESMGLRSGPADEAAVGAWLAANGRDSHPRHSYAAEDFGVTRARISAEFGDYHALFCPERAKSPADA